MARKEEGEVLQFGKSQVLQWWYLTLGWKKNCFFVSSGCSDWYATQNEVMYENHEVYNSYPSLWCF